ncbi:hypothetical protein BamMEX5DRAFT_5721 [Burkholderia ambifaria MEX-5]|uniref:Uncharacterized protein n=1 Tax=Burkholderia ambifaria MEX-5 TaxID=396597 RepID=B1TD55_9BURK|nr:hypothetical protein BamMEX5DRAFT_5721 [Burkholderia ambifaria MEX-5]
MEPRKRQLTRIDAKYIDKQLTADWHGETTRLGGFSTRS